MITELWEKNRVLCLGVVLVFLLFITTLYYIWSGWGLITVHAKEMPLAKVIKSIEWQGWVTIETNIDPNTLVTMDVDHVVLPEAMETLAANTDARWNLSFFIAPNHTTMLQGIQAFSSGTDLSNSGWKDYTSFTPFSLSTDEDDAVPDPYYQKWNVSQAQPDLQGYLQATAKAANVVLFAPVSWNPALSSPGAYPSSSITSGVAGLVYKAGGVYKEVLTLQSFHRGPRGDRPPGGDRRGGFGGGMATFDQDALWDRMTNVINGLPVEAQGAAKEKLQAEKDFWKGVQSLPDDQKIKAIREHLANNNNNRNWRNNPAKRAAAYAHMIQVKSAAMGNAPGAGPGNRGGGAAAPAASAGAPAAAK